MRCLCRHHVGISRTSFAGEEESELFHAFGSFPWLRFSVAFVFAVAVLLVEFLLATLALLLQTFDDIDCSSYVTIGIISVVAVGSDEAGGVILATEGVWCTWERFSVSKTRSRSERCE